MKEVLNTKENSNPHFIFYSTFLETVECLDDEEQLKFLKALINYGLYGTIPNFTKKDLAIFKQWQFALDTQKARQNAMKVNGSKGGRPKKENQKKPNINLGFQLKTKQKQNAEIEKEIEKEIYGDDEKSSLGDSSESQCISGQNSSSNLFLENSDNADLSSSKRKRFTPPTVEEVRAYCKERNNDVGAQNFVDFYQSKGWLVGTAKMKDWKAAVRNWENNKYGNYRCHNRKSIVDDVLEV